MKKTQIQYAYICAYMHIYVPNMAKGGIPEKSMKMQLRDVDLRSLGPSIQKLEPNNFFTDKIPCILPIFTVMLKLKLVFPFVKTSNLKPPKPSHQTLRNAIFFKKTNVISKILDFKGIGKKLEVAVFQKRSLKMIG